MWGEQSVNNAWHGNGMLRLRKSKSKGKTLAAPFCLFSPAERKRDWKGPTKGGRDRLRARGGGSSPPVTQLSAPLPENVPRAHAFFLIIRLNSPPD